MSGYSKFDKGCPADFSQLSRDKSLGPYLARFGGNSRGISKGFFEKGIWRFESSRPSQPVRSLRLACLCRENSSHCGALGSK